MKKCIFILLLGSIFYSCQNKVSSNLESYMSDIESDSVEDFKFAVITNFQWDVMYYFAAAGPFDVMEEITGKNYSNYQRKRRLIFMNESKIVYEEELADAATNGNEFYFYFEAPALGSNMESHQAFGVDQVFSVIHQGKKTYCFYPIN